VRGEPRELDVAQKKIMPRLDLQLDENGLRIRGDGDGISGTTATAQFAAAMSLELNLLNESAQDYFQNFLKGADAPVEPLEIDPDTGLPKLDLPTVFVPSLVDGMLDLPRRITIRTANGPRDPFDDPPEWFVVGTRKMFPKEDFDSKDDQEFFGEKAVMAFQSAMNSFNDPLDHWGFVEGKDGEDILVSEPYGVDFKGMTKLMDLLRIADWTFRIVGPSAHYPSATIRIEIKPVKLEGIKHAA
jgi:hypothetical protein